MKKKLQIIADRALKEAKDRKKKRQKHKKKTELNGPSGPEPTRYGDWEKKRYNLRFLIYLFNLLSIKL